MQQILKYLKYVKYPFEVDVNDISGHISLTHLYINPEHQFFFRDIAKLDQGQV